MTIGLSHHRTSWMMKTVAFIRSSAYLALGNALSSALQPIDAVEAYRKAFEEMDRLHAPVGSEPANFIAESKASLHKNIGNQFAKEHMHAEAQHEYKVSVQYAKIAGVVENFHVPFLAVGLDGGLTPHLERLEEMWDEDTTFCELALFFYCPNIAP